MIFVSSSDNYLYAFTADDSLRWKYKFAGIIDQWPAVGRDGTVYFSSGDSFLYAVNPDGSLKWRYGPDTVVGPPSPSVGEDGTIYVGTQNRELAAFNPDGTLKWSLPLDDGFIHASPAIGKDGTIYIGSENFFLYAVNLDGTLKWRFPTGRHIYDAAVIGSDGCIYVPSDDQYMYAINPDGSQRWKFPYGDPNSQTAEGRATATTPVIGGDGTLYFGTSNGSLTFGNVCGYLYALAPERTSGIQSDSTSFMIEKPYPNPFNPSTTIAFSLKAPSQVKIAVYSINGQKIADLTNKTLGAGRHSVVFDGSKYASGVYFYRFESNAGIKTGKMLLVK